MAETPPSGVRERLLPNNNNKNSNNPPPTRNGTPSRLARSDTPSIRVAAHHEHEYVAPEGAGTRDREQADCATIDWVIELQADRLRREETVLKKEAGYFSWFVWKLDAANAWIALTLIGVLTGLFATLVEVMVDKLTDWRTGHCTDNILSSMEYCDDSSWMSWTSLYSIADSEIAYFTSYGIYVFLCVMFATIAAVGVSYISPFAAGSGLPEVKVILSGFVLRGFLGIVTLFTKTFTIMVSVASGLNLGKEGPFVHIACALANVVTRLFPKYSKNEAKKRELLSAACAAGVSVAFGAPVGGVLFSIEEVSYYFAHKTLWRSFYCAVIAAMTMHSLNPLHKGKLVMFEVAFDIEWNWFEVFPVLLIGLFGGFVGSVFIKANIWWCNRRKTSWRRKFPIVEVAIVALVTATINYTNPFLRGSSSRTMATMFNDCDPSMKDSPAFNDLCGDEDPIPWLLLAALTKFVLVSFTYGLAVPSGLFIPTMGIGACFGRVLGIIFNNFVKEHSSWLLFATCSDHTSCIQPGLYAVIGAAACLGGVTRMTISLVVIMFELTGGIRYVLPIMVATMTAKFVADAFGRDGIYDAHIYLKGFPFLDSKSERIPHSTAEEVMTSPVSCLPARGITLASLDRLCRTSSYSGWPVIRSIEEPVLIGFATRIDIRNRLSQLRAIYPGSTNIYFGCETTETMPDDHVDFRQIVYWTPVQVTPQSPIEMVLELVKKLGPRNVLVTTEGKVEGIITRKDLAQHIHKLEKLGHTGSIANLASYRYPLTAPRMSSSTPKGSEMRNNGYGTIQDSDSQQHMYTPPTMSTRNSASADDVTCNFLPPSQEEKKEEEKKDEENDKDEEKEKASSEDDSKPLL